MEECDGSGVIAFMPYDSDWGVDYRPCPGCPACQEEEDAEG